MKLIRFAFTCSRKVPFYAHLCNRYLDYPELDVTVGWKDNTFILEAEGNQTQLEALASSISSDFLLSCWLTGAKMDVVDSRVGNKSPIKHAPFQLPFCSRCHTSFSDNQSPQFGELDLACPVCHGERHSSASLTFSLLSQHAAEFLESGRTQLSLNGHTYTFGINPVEPGVRNQILVTNPNRLNNHFAVENRHVLALSSIEKPRLTLRPSDNQSGLTDPLYDVCFAWNREISVFAELLRQRGIDHIYYASAALQPAMAWVENGWSQIDNPRFAAKPSAINCVGEPLHEAATIRGLRASWAKGTIRFDFSDTGDSSSRESQAICALHGGSVESGILRNTAVIYFSNQAPGQLVTLDRTLNTESFFMLRPLPEAGSAVLELVEQEGHHELLARFRQQFPEDCDALAAYSFTGFRDNLTTLYAAAAFILGLAHSAMTKDQLADTVLAAALKYRGKNSHRIDFAFDNNPDISGLDFTKTLASLMAFRLGTDGDEGHTPKLAFGLMDSLADYLSNWIEHLDGNIGLSSITLAGNELANEVLANRISLRVGKNFPLFVNRRLTLDGSNLSAGALFLKQRRRG